MKILSIKRYLGYNLIELMTVLSIIGVTSMVAVPSFVSQINHDRIVANANYLSSTFKLARSEAVKREATVEIVLKENGEWQVLLDNELLTYFKVSHDSITVRGLTNLTITPTGETLSAQIMLSDDDANTSDWCFRILVSGQSKLEKRSCVYES